MDVADGRGPPASCSTQAEMRILIGHRIYLHWLSLTPGRGVELPHSAVSDVHQVVLAAPEAVVAKTPNILEILSVIPLNVNICSVS